MKLIRTDLLKGIIVTRGLTQNQVAEQIGISNNTFYRKMKKGVFRSDEIEAMISLLEIEDPCKIFFGQKVTLKDTNFNNKS